jgi:superfamily I DNA/RNA helicase
MPQRRTRRKQRADRAARDPFDLGTLNPAQRDAVLHDDGPLLVLAGAGSGKTRVIIFRITRLIRDGVPPERILGVTFTNKAAREMRERLTALAGRRGGDVHLSTFHALGLTIIREESKAAGLSRAFAIYDAADQLSLVRDLLRQVKVADRRLDPARVLELILRTKRERRAEVELRHQDDYELAAYELYPRYVAQMRAFNAVDFDDLLLRAQDVLGRPAVRKRWQSRFDYLLVDEYQDTSPDQLDLLQALAGKRRNVCVVGDDDQSIYAWRGAAADNILRFGKQFDGAKEVVLDQNYRSTGHILAAANAVISNNAARKAKQLWSAGGCGEPVEEVCCADGDDETAFVCDTIGKLVYDGARHDDIAILYRANVQSRAFEEALALERIPYRVVGGQPFFERKEVRDALAYLAVAQNNFDEVALRRIINVPPRGIGTTSVERLAAWGEVSQKGLWGALCNAGRVPDLPKAAAAGARDLVDILAPASKRLRSAKKGDAVHLARRLFADLKLRDAVLSADDSPVIAARRLENLDEVLGALDRFEQTRAQSEPLAEFLRSAALVKDDQADDSAMRGKVTLMTLHSAKGLEFPFVFLVGMEEELLPHRKTLEAGGELSEERRLCYVGMTRARRRLWMTWSRRRRRYGKAADRTPSRFLQELPDSDAVKRRNRDEPQSDAEADAAAQDFFQRMREQLEID